MVPTDIQGTDVAILFEQALVSQRGGIEVMMGIPVNWLKEGVVDESRSAGLQDPAYFARDVPGATRMLQRREAQDVIEKVALERHSLPDTQHVGGHGWVDFGVDDVSIVRFPQARADVQKEMTRFIADEFDDGCAIGMGGNGWRVGNAELCDQRV